MTTHAMIDIETLGVTPDSVIMTFGAVKFDPYNQTAPHSDFYKRLDVDSQIAAGRKVDDNTVAWWNRQPQHIIDEAFSDQGRVSLDDWKAELNRYMVGVDKIWCQGPQFDMVMIEDLYRQFDFATNWQYWQVRDCRTLFDLMPSDPRKALASGNLHNALDDARIQAICVQKTFKHFNL